MQQFVYVKHIEIILKLKTFQRQTMSKQNIEPSKQNHSIFFSVIWRK